VSLKIVTREQWGAKPVTKPGHPVSMGPVSMVFIHHSDSSDSEGEEAEVRRIQSLHMAGGVSSDIDYSWLVGRAADVYEGRGWGVEEGGTGTGPGEKPDGNMGGVSYSICCLGNYTQKKPTTEMIDAIRELIHEGVERGSITKKVYDPDNIRGHRDVRATNCPGDNLFDQLDAIRVPWEGEEMPYLFNDDCRQGYAEARNSIVTAADPAATVRKILGNRINENDHKERDRQIGRHFAAQDWLMEQASSPTPSGRRTPEAPTEPNA
jgi:hypothetical protein